MAHAMPSSVHWGVLTSILILGPKLPGWRFYSERRVLRDLAILTLLHGICRILTRTEDRDHQAAHTLRMGRTYAILTYAFWELSPAVLSEGWRCLPLLSARTTQNGNFLSAQGQPRPIPVHMFTRVWATLVLPPTQVSARKPHKCVS